MNNFLSLKKLHKSLLTLAPFSNAFLLPNLERTDRRTSTISTTKCLPNQIDLTYLWQIIEDVPEPPKSSQQKNARHILEQSGIDLKSSVQLIFDVFSQLMEVLIHCGCGKKIEIYRNPFFVFSESLHYVVAAFSEIMRNF